MKPHLLSGAAFAAVATTSALLAAAAATPAHAAAVPPALTIYNQDFAVVRERLALDLPGGASALNFAGATTRLEADSVVLRDPAGKVDLRILEQSYRADTASPGLMLSFFEGKELTFLVRDQAGKEYPVRGKVIRSGYTPGGGHEAPIIEVDGQLRFSLPGEPVFPSLGDDTILQPTLGWQVWTPAAAKLEAELSYLTGGLSWQAAYNFVLPEKGDTMDVVGWVTLNNTSGKVFTDAAVKLMAGEVNKLVEPELLGMSKSRRNDMLAMAASAPADVTEKAFDEFHLYALPRPVTLRDRETKQVEFIRATGVKSQTLYVYDGAALGNYRGWGVQQARNNPDYGTQSNKKVWVMREFKNTKENNLGLPFPAGRTRFYRRDDADGRLEFTGENTIEHTPQGETVRLYTGDAFDIVGERTRTDYALSSRQDQAEESFEIKVRNRKAEPIEVRVVEHLYRWVNWTVLTKSAEFTKTDAQTIEFRVPLAPDEEKTITYRVRYDWK